MNKRKPLEFDGTNYVCPNDDIITKELIAIVMQAVTFLCEAWKVELKEVLCAPKSETKYINFEVQCIMLVYERLPFISNDLLRFFSERGPAKFTTIIQTHDKKLGSYRYIRVFEDVQARLDKYFRTEEAMDYVDKIENHFDKYVATHSSESFFVKLNLNEASPVKPTPVPEDQLHLHNKKSRKSYMKIVDYDKIISKIPTQVRLLADEVFEKVCLITQFSPQHITSDCGLSDYGIVRVFFSRTMADIFTPGAQRAYLSDTQIAAYLHRDRASVCYYTDIKNGYRTPDRYVDCYFKWNMLIAEFKLKTRERLELIGQVHMVEL